MVMGVDPAQATNPTLPPPNPALASPTLSPLPGTVGPSDVGNSSSTPSMMALPVQPANSSSNGPGIDASDQHKFYTFSVDLRETYDDNVNTASSNPQSALETTISPSVLVNFPMENTQFSASYTFGATYYSNTGGTGSNVQYSNQFIAQLKHDFSERFSLNASDEVLDSTEPNLFGTTGTPYRNGQNISNAFSSGLSAQWTPLVGAQTTYANTIVRYSDGAVATGQDSMENTASQSVSFSLVPKISVNFGGVFDTITYDDVSRGYTSYSVFVGSTWQALPNVTASLRGGGSYTETQQTAFNGQTSNVGSLSPYVDLSASWQIGERSSLSGDYSHEVTPSDQVGANGQESDRISANFNYAVSPLLSTHLQLVYTYSDISGGLINSSSLQSYDETDYAVDAGAAYNFVKYFSLNLDITESGVSSQLPDRNYSRSQLSVGVRGTY